MMFVISYPQFAVLIFIAWLVGITPQDVTNVLSYLSGLAIILSAVAFYAADVRFGKVKIKLSIDNKYELAWAIFFWCTVLGWAQGISVLTIISLLQGIILKVQ